MILDPKLKETDWESIRIVKLIYRKISLAKRGILVEATMKHLH